MSIKHRLHFPRLLKERSNQAEQDLFQIHDNIYFADRIKALSSFQWESCTNLDNTALTYQTKAGKTIVINKWYEHFVTMTRLSTNATFPIINMI